jgi:hypothetical protein
LFGREDNNFLAVYLRRLHQRCNVLLCNAPGAGMTEGAMQKSVQCPTVRGDRPAFNSFAYRSAVSARN